VKFFVRRWCARTYGSTDPRHAQDIDNLWKVGRRSPIL
jgi:hypothetical protein